MNAEALAARALALCQIPSVITHEKAIADFVEGWALGRFSRAHVFRHSHSLVVGNREDKRPTIALVGHLDTIPAHPESGPARIEGDRLHGLGASDMKGALAVMMTLAEELELEKLPVNILWVFYEREEGSYLESGLIPLFENIPQLKTLRFAIAMEPTDLTVQVGCMGTMHVMLTFRGNAAHSARPWQGENALHKAGPLLTEMSKLQLRETVVSGFSFYEVMSATMAQGGRAKNVIPERFDMNVNYRFAPGKSVEQAKDDVLTFVAGRAEVDFVDISPSGRVCADNPYYQRLVKVTGTRVEAKQAWTDVARFAEVGVDAVNFGPGETTQAHQKNESAPIASLAEAFKKLKTFVESPLS
jgi:succinyl-diaminopimelate desuccinylase